MKLLGVGGTAFVVLAIAVLAIMWEPWIKIPEKRAALLNTLVDPESASFRNEAISSWGALCGEFNSRNASGGYSGFRKFYVHGHAVAVEGDWPPSDVVDTARLVESLEVEIAARQRGSATPEALLQERVRRFSARWHALCPTH